MPLPIWPAPITPTVRISAITTASRLNIRRPHRYAPRLVTFLLPHPAAPPPSLCCDAARPVRRASEACGGEGGHQFRYGGLVVGDEAIVGDLEYRRVGVLVDGDDHLGILHPRQ